MPRPTSPDACGRAPTALLRRFAAHPFLSLAAACLYVGAVFDVTAQRLVSAPGVLAVACVCALCAIVRYAVCRRRDALWLLLPAAIPALLLALPQTDRAVFYLALAALAPLLALAAWLLVRRRMTYKTLAALMMAAGFALRVAYVLYTPVTLRQHDVGLFGGADGHAGYIEYIYQNLRLPGGDPREVWQFYHPPLHYILSALWLRLQTAVGLPYARAVENLQLLSLYGSSACMLVGYKCFRKLNARGPGLAVACALVAFHPTLLLLSGSVNNDMLSICLCFGAMLAAMRWYERPSMPRILALALLIGLGMMAKLSVAMVAPAVAALFAWKLIADKAHRRALIGQFVCFGLVCAPLGLGWQVYANLRFGMPLSYVPMLSETSRLYVGEHTLWARLFDFRTDSVWLSWYATGASANEYNVFLGLLKTALFGETRLFALPGGIVARTGDLVCKALFYAQLALIACAVVSAAYALFARRSGLAPAMQPFWGLIVAVALGSYVVFCIRYPYTCTMNMRYAVPLIFASAAFMGSFISDEGRARRALSVAFAATTAAFCICSAGAYTLLALVM